MSTADVLNQIVLGCLAGILGQGLRVIVGLKKVADAAGSSGQNPRERIDSSWIFISLFIGAIAGGLFRSVRF